MVRLPIIAGAFILLGAVSANAQSAPTASAPAASPAASSEPAAAADGGRDRFRGMHRRAFEMAPKAAGFRFKRDGAEIGIRCASNETTRACVDAASVLIDKIASMKSTP